jgi:hypothetical protein
MYTWSKYCNPEGSIHLPVLNTSEMKTYMGFITNRLKVEPFRLRMRAQTEEAWMGTISTHLQNAKAKWNTIAINVRY